MKNIVLIGLLAFGAFRVGQAADPRIAQFALKVVFLEINRGLLDSTRELWKHGSESSQQVRFSVPRQHGADVTVNFAT